MKAAFEVTRAIVGGILPGVCYLLAALLLASFLATGAPAQPVAEWKVCVALVGIGFAVLVINEKSR